MSFDAADQIIEGQPSSPLPQTTGNLIQNQEYLNDFLVESKEHLESIEMNMLTLQTDYANTDVINSVFRDFHTIKGLAGFVSQSLVQRVAHQTESLLDKCRKGEQKVTENLIYLILKSTDYIKSLCDNLGLNEDIAFKSQITSHLQLLEQHTTWASTATHQLNEQSDVQHGQAPANLVVTYDNNASSSFKKTKSKDDSGYVRIPVEKIDSLVDMVGELVISHSQFEELSKELLTDNDTLSSNLHRVFHLTKEIQNLSISLRMVTLKSVFQRILRIGKDTVSTLGKDVEIVLYGEETEIDRSVVERLVDPLVHLIKNSIYHGIEDSTTRAALEKPTKGLVKLEAYSTKGHVYIVLSDDGKGIDTGKVLQKAIDLNLADPFIDYSEDELLDFLFLPGFSTLDKADSISGRGVGLDVVKTQIAKMGGKIQIKNAVGAGCSFVMKLPINMEIINGTIVDIAGTEYIIPTVSIHTIFRPKENQWVTAKGIKNAIYLRDKIIPVINTKKVLNLNSFNSEEGMILVIESGQKLKALPVTHVLENRDIIVKSLGVDFENLSYAFGASILGNGKIAIILDVENLCREGEC